MLYVLRRLVESELGWYYIATASYPRPLTNLNIGLSPSSSQVSPIICRLPYNTNEENFTMKKKGGWRKSSTIKNIIGATQLWVHVVHWHVVEAGMAGGWCST